MPIAVIALFLGAFCVGTTEFVVAGLLPEVARDLDVTIPAAGYLITAYALGVAIGGPVLTLGIARYSRKRNLLLLLAIFVAGHLWCATAGTYESLLSGRLLVALSHGSYFGVAGVVAVSLVPENKRGAAIAWLFAGISVANILGVPLGTAIGNWLGWRATFWIIGGAALLVMGAIAWTVPADKSTASEGSRIASQVKAIGNQQVLMAYLTFAVMLIGFWSFFTFVAPFLTEVVQVDQRTLPVMLFLFGAGATLGTFIGGKLADQIPQRTLIIGISAQAVAFLAVFVAGAGPIIMGGVLFGFGVIMFVPAASIVNRVLEGASAAPDLASTLISTAANLGIAAGAALGAQLLAGGVGLGYLPLSGVVFSALAAGVILISIRKDPRSIVGL
ncbi:MFS transporter [Cognatishimia maritima]|uniref:MFS transporter, DHA1 family, arabinose polymer transporter n=1 Tax=Cognatishimia maritima TaxID=870908 RepID=A0A1M5K1Y6_9RHOB|nr:MFS transporter [Cognatishimia maritima]SHG46735.1 MFS transporter, DHA1 family, arabinose polymer transporter [Cognatishimia maritima]